MEEEPALSERQFGFRKGRSTIQAVEWVQNKARETGMTLCILVTLNEKNALNTVSWRKIFKELSISLGDN